MPFEFHSYKDKAGNHLLYYYVYYDGDQFPINTKVRCKKSDFKNGKIKGDIKASLLLSNIEDIATDAVGKAKERLPFWTIDQLKNHIELRLRHHEVDQGGNIRINLYDWWSSRIERYESLSQFDTAMHHENSRTAFFEHLDKDMCIQDLSRSQLTKLKDILLYKGDLKRSTSTLNGYFRDLRAVINDAIIEQDLDIKNPFTGFEMPKMKTKKHATLTWDELVRFREVEPKTNFQQVCKDMFLFAYFSMGMRVRDLFQLKWDHIQGDRLIYSTSKTESQFDFNLLPEAQEILSRYNRKSKYIFPVIKTGLTGKDHVKEIKNKTSAVNRSLKRLAGYVKIDPKKISNHVSRHTFASVNDHLSDHDMQIMLGHKENRTTVDYRKRLSNQDNLINQTKR